MESESDVVLPKAVVAFWKELDLETLRGKLDEQGLKVAEHQDDSVKSRKALAERTKGKRDGAFSIILSSIPYFKKSVAPEVMKLVAPLLKSYQEEVDRLTTRAKHGEAAFLDVYKKLYEAPDPAPVLATGLESASRIAELQVEVSSLSKELSEYRAESKELKNQDLTIRRLEEKVRNLEADLEEKDQSLEEALKGAAADTEKRLAEEARAREERLQVELAAAQAELDAVHRAHQATQTQLFSVQEKSGEEAATAREAAERAEEEVERVQEWVAALEREKQMLLQKIEQGQSQDANLSSSDDGMMPAALSAAKEELRVQRVLAAKLQNELIAAQERAALEAAAAATAAENLQASLAAKEAHCAALETELSSRPTAADLEEVRQQARVLRALVHGSEDEDGANFSSTGDGKNTTNSSTNGGPLTSHIEAALLAKSRQLEHKLTMTRLELAEARGEAETAAAKVAELEADVEDQRQLIARLEEDLVAAEKSLNIGGNSSGSGNPINMGSSVPGGGDLYLNNSSTGGGDDGDSMVGVLCAQRDRLRTRVTELETSLVTRDQQLAKLRSDSEAAKADNLALVERLRFVQGYSGGKKGGDLEAGGDVVGRYMKEYEERINPFSDFQAKEREARRKHMPIQDKAAYALSSLLSGNRTARSIILVYALFLHFGVFLLIAGVSHRHADKMEELEELCAKAAGTAGSLPGGGVGRLLF